MYIYILEGAVLLDTSVVALSIDAVSSSCSPVARRSLRARSQVCVKYAANCSPVNREGLQLASQSIFRKWKIDPYRVQNRAQIAQMGCRSAQERPRALQECPKSGRGRPKSAPRAPNSVPRAPQESPKSAPVGPKRPPKAPQRALGEHF